MCFVLCNCEGMREIFCAFSGQALFKAVFRFVLFVVPASYGKEIAIVRADAILHVHVSVDGLRLISEAA